MDMAFLRRAERILEEREPVRLDHQLLIAALAAQQTATARARVTVSRVHVGPREEDPMIEVLLAGPRWREASLRQRGCFNRAESGRQSNGA
jgi:hypothetical protein